MNIDAFKRGFIKRAQEYGVAPYYAEQLLKLSFVEQQDPSKIMLGPAGIKPTAPPQQNNNGPMLGPAGIRPPVANPGQGGYTPGVPPPTNPNPATTGPVVGPAGATQNPQAAPPPLNPGTPSGVPGGAPPMPNANPNTGQPGPVLPQNGQNSAMRGDRINQILQKYLSQTQQGQSSSGLDVGGRSRSSATSGKSKGPSLTQ